ncbi:MAG: preprotein translocase subunit SecE [Bacteroidota bacterium]
MSKFKSAFKAYYDELVYKVTWPSITELQSNTVTVLVASLILALIIAGMDFISKNVMSLLYGLAN